MTMSSQPVTVRMRVLLPEPVTPITAIRTTAWEDIVESMHLITCDLRKRPETSDYGIRWERASLSSRPCWWLGLCSPQMFNWDCYAYSIPPHSPFDAELLDIWLRSRKVASFEAAKVRILDFSCWWTVVKSWRRLTQGSDYRGATFIRMANQAVASLGLVVRVLGLIGWRCPVAWKMSHAQWGWIACWLGSRPNQHDVLLYMFSMPSNKRLYSWLLETALQAIRLTSQPLCSRLFRRDGDEGFIHSWPVKYLHGSFDNPRGSVVDLHLSAPSVCP